MRQALGTANEVQPKAQAGDDSYKDASFGESKSDLEHTGALVYTDSSTFLKVIIMNFIYLFLFIRFSKYLKFRELNRPILTMTTVNILWTQVNDLKISSEMSV